MTPLKPGLALATCVVALTVCGLAAAKDQKNKTILAVDGSLTAAVNAGTNPVGGSVGGRLGWHYVGLGGLLALRPELGGSYTNVVDTDIGRIFGGGRFGVELPFVGVYAYGHAGYGWGTPNGDLTYDLGAAGDLLLFDGLRPGVHVDYTEIVNHLQLMNVGGHLEFVF